MNIIDQAVEYYLNGNSLKTTAALIGYCSGTSVKKMLVKRGIPRRQPLPRVIIYEETPCPNCDTIFLKANKRLKGRKKPIGFCSRSCANTRDHSEETRGKISKGIKAYNKAHPNRSISNVDYSYRCHSKGEIEVRDYFINNFPNDGWTYGGSLSIEGKRLSRDLYSNKLKICFEYDGIWHFKDIHNQLAKKQLKDLLLEKWCLLNGYRLIRLEDHLYKKNKEYWLKQVEEAIYGEAISQVVKFYPEKYLKN